MWIYKGKGSHTFKISDGSNNCPRLRVSKTIVKIKDDYHSSIRMSKPLLDKLQP